MGIVEEERTVPEFHSASHTYLCTLPGGGSVSSRLVKYNESSWHADCIREIAMSVPGPDSDNNYISIRIDFN